MSRSLANIFIVFLSLFFVFVVFGGMSKADDAESTKDVDDTPILADSIWLVCEDELEEEKQINCFETYTNCIINQGLPWKDEYIFNCMKTIYEANSAKKKI